MRRLQLFAVIAALALGWVARGLLNKPAVPTAHAQMIEDVTDLLRGRPGSMYLTVSNQGDKLFFWRFDQVKAGAYMPDLIESKVFEAGVRRESE